MEPSPLEAYLATVRPDAHGTVRALAAAVDAAGAGFDCRVTYRMLVYTFGQRWHEWVVAIGVSQKAVNLRFLHGAELDDPAGILRAGSTTAAAADFTSASTVDPVLVTAYVREAVAKHPNQPLA
jgi:hypothetical protein